MREKEKVPRYFLTAYLKAKGWKDALWFHCWTCHKRLGLHELKHPVKWLWEHASKGHNCGMNLCHTWKRAVGQPWGLNPDFEHWVRWWWATWNPKTEQFDLEIEFTECEGEEIDATYFPQR